MSYGMFNDVMRILGSGQDAVEILMSDPALRDLVVRRLFTDTRKPISDINEDLINPFEIEASPCELDEIVAWVADHVLHFMVSTAAKTQPVVEKYQTREEPSEAS